MNRPVIHRQPPRSDMRQPFRHAPLDQVTRLDDLERSLRGDPIQAIRDRLNEPKRGEAWFLIFGAAAAFWALLVWWVLS